MRINRRTAFAGLAASLVTPAALAQTPEGPVYWHPGLQGMLLKLRASDWEGAAAQFRALPPQSALALIEDLGETTPIGFDFSGLTKQPMGLTLLGGMRVGWAWRVRGHGAGDTVVGKRADGFMEHLQKAEHDLGEAAAADADDGVARACQFRVYKGMNEKNKVLGVLPGFLAAGRRPVQGLANCCNAIAEKWLGSSDEALAFARAHAGDIAPASHALVADAHIDVISYISMQNQPQAADAYPHLSRVYKEVADAADAYLAGNTDDAFAAAYADGAFSFFFYNAGDEARLRTHLGRMNDVIGGYWRLMGEPEAVVEGVRKMRVALGIGRI